MIRIAIVEDEEKAFDELNEALQLFSKETGAEFAVSAFKDAVAFLDNYQSNYDLVFMDIQMPYLNGMKAAEKLRELDEKVALIFVTNLTQYAVKGYSVNAKDYVLKPVQYNRFQCMMKRVLCDVNAHVQEEIFIKNGGNMYRIRLSDIRYIEIRDHFILYHMDGKEFSSWGTMKEVEAQLKGKGFCRLDKSNIVNLKYVSDIEGDKLHLFDGETLFISRPRKKAVKEAFASYVRGERK